MSVADYLLFVARLKGVPNSEIKSRTEQVMERCFVSDVKSKLISKLSKGYRQRVGLAQAIIHNPDVLILDEPTSGLDPQQINETRRLIKSLAGEHTIILSTHILPEVETICQKVIIINRGRLVATDSVEHLKSRGLSNAVQVQVHTDGQGSQSAVHQRLEQVPGVSKVLDRPAAAGRFSFRSGEHVGPGFPGRYRPSDRAGGMGPGRIEVNQFDPRRSLPADYGCERWRRDSGPC